MAKKFYAVHKGRKTGVFETWAQCKTQVDGFSGAVYKSFTNLEDARAFAQGVSHTPAASEPVPDDNQATAYVDGSYNIHDGRFSYGAVIFFGGEKHTLSEAFDDKDLASMRNVAGEIKGAEAAMRFCIENGIKSLCIYHDYEGIASWPLGRWSAQKDGTKAYKLFYDEASKHLDIQFIKVKGHSGDRYNDEADSLAKAALGIK